VNVAEVTRHINCVGMYATVCTGDRREPDVFEMISTHLFFSNEKSILLQKNLRNYMPFELHIMNER